MGSEFNEEVEGLNTIPCSMSEFLDDLKGTLQFVTGLADMEKWGLTRQEVLVPKCIIGTPGVGKTAGIISIIDEINKELERKNMTSEKLGFKKIQLGQKVVGALDGIPVVINGEVQTLMVDELPNEERDGKNGVLFLDELTTVDEQQMQPALGLADDSRSIGKYKLPDNWLVVAAGNGPDCTNFIRFDDAMAQRFELFEVQYDYAKDWRKWAHENNISPDIIAFLNFKPERMCMIESTDMDKAGKMAPSPRTWTHFDGALRKRQAISEMHGKTLSPDDIGRIASRFIGVSTAREFTAFLRYKDTLKYSPKKIFEGTEKDPELMQKQEFHLLLEACLTYLKQLINSKCDPENPNDVPDEVETQIINYLNWLFKMDVFDTENVIAGFSEMISSVKEFSLVCTRPNFFSKCPAFLEFVRNHHDLLQDNMSFFESMYS